MTDKNKKTIMLNTLILCFCVIVIAIFCIVPNKKLDKDVVDIYTINFNSEDGSSIAAIEIEEGSTIAIPENPTREGYIFVGWMYNGEPFDFSQEVTGDITLTAEWKKIDESKKYYTITFNTDGGTTIANQVLEEGESITKPENPYKEGYEFVNWQVNGVEYTFTEPITSDITITAIYNQISTPEEPETPTPQEKTYRVTFNAGGGTLGSGCNAQNVKEGNKARNTCNVSRNGYNFAGWTPNIDSNINGNTTFTATWTERPKALVTFNVNGGTGNCGLREVYIGDTLNLSNICTPSRNHYTFLGWADSTGSVKQNIVVNGATTLKASWTPISHKLSHTLGGDVGGSTYTVVSIPNYPNNIQNIHVCNNKQRCIDFGPGRMFTNTVTFFDSGITSCIVTYTDTTDTFNCM